MDIEVQARPKFLLLQIQGFVALGTKKRLKAAVELSKEILCSLPDFIGMS